MLQGQPQSERSLRNGWYSPNHVAEMERLWSVNEKSLSHQLLCQVNHSLQSHDQQKVGKHQSLWIRLQSRSEKWTISSIDENAAHLHLGRWMRGVDIFCVDAKRDKKDFRLRCCSDKDLNEQQCKSKIIIFAEISVSVRQRDRCQSFQRSYFLSWTDTLRECCFHPATPFLRITVVVLWWEVHFKRSWWPQEKLFSAGSRDIP